MELISISHLVFTKASPASILKILSQKQMIIISYIRKQEKGIVEFITENKLSLYEPKPENHANLM